MSGYGNTTIASEGILPDGAIEPSPEHRTVFTYNDVVVDGFINIVFESKQYSSWLPTKKVYVQAPRTPHSYRHASLPDGTKNEICVRNDGVCVCTERVVQIRPAATDTINFTPDYSSATGSFIWYLQSEVRPLAYTGAVCNALRFSHLSSVDESFYFQAGGTQLIMRYAALNGNKSAASDFSVDVGNGDPLEILAKLTTPRVQYSSDWGETWQETDPNMVIELPEISLD